MSENSLICPVCGENSSAGETHYNCLGKYQLSGLVCLWDYDSVTQSVIKAIKYGRNYDMANELLDRFIRILINDDVKRFNSFLDFLEQENTCIAYVPMYRKEEKKRGFNQARLIAKGISKRFNKPVIDLLVKTRKTEEQAKLNKEQRLENLKNSFRISHSAEAELRQTGRVNVLLVDDVFTTGATLRECCKTMKEHNNKLEINKVWGFTLARTI